MSDIAVLMSMYYDTKVETAFHHEYVPSADQAGLDLAALAARVGRAADVLLAAVRKIESVEGTDADAEALELATSLAHGALAMLSLTAAPAETLGRFIKASGAHDTLAGGLAL